MARDTQAIKVKNESHPAKVAGAIAHAVRERAFADELNLEVLVIGQQAVYVAIKALGRAQAYLAEERPDLFLGFNVRSQEVNMDGVTHAGYVFSLGWLMGV